MDGLRWGCLRGGAITTSTEFDPPLDPVILNRGEQAFGWLVSDVPARHGQLVMHDLSGRDTAPGSTERQDSTESWR